MGNSHPNIARSRRSSSPSYTRKSLDAPDVLKKINEKECVFIAMQSEIDKAIGQDNREAMMSLTSEISAHIVDLNQLKKIELTSTSRGRAQKIIYNFELSLAKLKSIYNYDTAMKKERDRHFSPASFYVNPIEAEHQPDIVSDLIRFDSSNSVNRSSYRENGNALLKVPENIVSPQSRSNSLYSNQPTTFEEAFMTIESEFDVLKDQAQRPVEDVNEYYQMDKGIFYLYVKVKNLELPENSMLNERKVKLIKELAEFRALLDKKSGELEEQREINQEINTLELLLDSTSEHELPTLKIRAMELQVSIEKSSRDPHLAEQKIELLRRLATFMERIADTCPSPSLEHSVEHIYGNLNSLQEEMDILKAQEEANTIYSNVYKNATNPENNVDNAPEPLDKEEAIEHLGREEYLDEEVENKEEVEEESIYGNVEVIRQSIDPKLSRNFQKNGLHRGTVYINADAVERHTAYGNNVLPFHDGKIDREVITKRPLPLPRNYDDKVINDLPKYWQRLNELFDKESLNDTDYSEVADIQRHAEVAQNLFERKIKRIFDKFEDSVDL